MGYYTDYKIFLRDADPSKVNSKESEQYLEWVEKELIDEYPFFDAEWRGAGRAKWYSHEEDLKKFSIMYPDCIFILTGIGEETFFDDDAELMTDIWIKYFHKGKFYKDELKFEFPEFNANYLE